MANGRNLEDFSHLQFDCINNYVIIHIMRKMRSLSITQVDCFKNKFIEQRNILLAPKQINLIDDLEGDEVEIAQGLVINDMVEKLSLREKDLLIKITEALQRIEEGSFGLCMECEEPIPEKRLNVIPYCTMCVSCAETQEKLSKSYAS
jgi:phage/conjugal plasmid C-4 type zinc finger TraR family protein